MTQLSLIEHLLQILRDPITQGISAILAALGVVISIVMVRRDRANEKKELTIEVLTNMPLFSASPLVQDKLRATYEGREISDLSMIHFVVRNSGRQTVRPEDFYSPIFVRLSPSARIDEVEIVSVYPKGLTVKVEQSGSNSVEIAKTLMNPGDSVGVKIVANGNDGRFEPEARIAGVDRIGVRDRTTSDRMEAGRLTAGVILTGVVVGIFVNWVAQSSLAVSWIVTLSIVNFAVFGYDKTMAKRQSWRVPEIIFHLISICGGAPGAITGMHVFRHKTRITAFWIVNLLAVSIWLIVMLFLQR